MQLGAAEHKAAQRILERLLLFGVECGGINRLVFGIQLLVGAQGGEKFRNRRQHGVKGGAQFGGVANAFEVAYGAPGAAQPFGRHIKRGRKPLPVGRKIRLCGFIQRSLRLLQQLRDGGLHLFRADGVKARQSRKIEQGIGGGDCGCGRLVHTVKFGDQKARFKAGGRGIVACCARGLREKPR